MEKKIKFELNHKFVKMNCMVREDGKMCPFLECNGKIFECINFTNEGVKIHRLTIPVKSKNEGMIKLGCDYLIQKILRNKQFFIGKIVEYTDDANTEEKRVVNITHDRKKRQFIIHLKTCRVILSFPYSIHTDYLCIQKLKNENIIRIFNKLASSSSIDIFL